MKILNYSQIKAADQFTIENEPISSIDLMERASVRFTESIFELVHDFSSYHIIAGKGNNGGDGLAIARLLHDQGKKVRLSIIDISSNASADFQINYERLPSAIEVSHIQEAKQLEYQPEEVIIDAIFGVGLDRPLAGEFKNIIDRINEFNAFVVSVDMPSGLFCDQSNQGTSMIKADWVFTFQTPKLSLLLPENHIWIKHWKVIDIGLHPQYFDSISTHYSYQEKNDFTGWIAKPEKFSHKGSHDKALLITGSKSMPGAGLLSTEACLRTGIGYLYQVNEAVREMTLTQFPSCIFQDYVEHISFDAAGIGSGLGQEPEYVEQLDQLLDQNKPMVIDADAITYFEKNPEWFKRLPANSIFSPHPGELKRLIGEWRNDFEKLELTQKFCSQYKTTLIIKGAHSVIVTPEHFYFNSSGNPGLAKAGSGDVLTGLLTRFLAHFKNAEKAARFAVFYHGYIADQLIDEFGIEGMLPSDLAEHAGRFLKGFY